MDTAAAGRVTGLFERRGQLDRLDKVEHADVQACLDRADGRLRAAVLLDQSELWEAAYTTAYDAFRTAADAIVLQLGFRVPATPGAHRVATDIAHAALSEESSAFAPAGAERFRQGRHESEYFDPQRPVDKSADDVQWALDRARSAIDAAVAASSAE